MVVITCGAKIKVQKTHDERVERKSLGELSVSEIDQLKCSRLFRLTASIQCNHLCALTMLLLLKHFFLLLILLSVNDFVKKYKKYILNRQL